MDLRIITSLLINRTCLYESYEFLQQSGMMGCEAIALWAGHRSGAKFHATETIIPDQTPICTEDGLCYIVESSELFRLNKYLYDHQLELVAQLHTHSRLAYHSELDDTYPIVTTIGGISIVIPNFAQGEIDMLKWAIYRLSERSKWESLSSTEIKKIFELEELL